MNSDYQMWLTANGEKEKLRFPVHPEKIDVKMAGKNTSVDISGLGEITIMQDRPAVTITFSCFFPAARFPGIQVENLTPPSQLAQKIWDWKNSKKPVHFLVTGTSFNMTCTIEDYSCNEQGGDVGTLYYSLTLKEYREVSARQVKALATPRFRCLIYDNQYGSEIKETIIAGDTTPEFIESDMPRLVKDALSPDTRILDVSDFSFLFSDEWAFIHFKAKTIFGETVVEEVI